jgi:hypothetical protein
MGLITDFGYTLPTDNLPLFVTIKACSTLA